jgi:cytochrome c oxidase subunit 2
MRTRQGSGTRDQGSGRSLVRATAVLPVTATVMAACSGPQSALVPAGRDAEAIAHLFNVMTAGSLLVWAAVVIIAVYAIRVRGPHSERAANLLIVGGGVALPTIALGALLAFGLPAVPALLALPPNDALVIHVIGKQWWWRVQYVTPNGTIETANELRLPVGQRVRVQLSSPDVIHSFWVPSLAGKMDMIPGRVTHLALEPTRTGVFRGACAEYCGASHALMAFEVVVVDPREFDGWLQAQSASAQPASTPLAARGEGAFLANGCSACHTIRGTRAVGRIGPDLTHVGSRLRIGAGTLDNQPDAFVAWISDTDRFKPGVHMPAFRALGRDDLLALAAYLDSLQ